METVKLKVNELWRPRSAPERQVAAETRRLFTAYEQARVAAAALPGWMYWKRYPNDREYLVRAYDRTGRGTTLGSRSDVTESQFLQFKARQVEAKMQLKLARDNLKLHARFAKAARLNRVPRDAAAVLRACAEIGGPSVKVVSAHALYAYEALAEILFEPRLMSSESLELEVEGEDGGGAAGVEAALLSADPTYRRAGDGFEWINAGGMVVRSRRNPPAEAGSDLAAPAALSQVVIDQDGMPLDMKVGDPREFARSTKSVENAGALEVLFARAAPLAQLPMNT